eukprot:CAMPEP_0175939778 /NCGR_PEP_ID=MMETSP0108-20121206/23447_1 /TAXON_ID=195067 ORGANISM="Goniomonas pacifica, Strain CCMP1869" /NCGR_SAMPLE_ID=MMETSP0108 /ASSEMBLY_ACC=CAM_ASM_000204 /LENGTH=157 /DNA_ID=CAMNT_0017264191 /DNA_START=54 /DNA_END=524 /DNA_ORIENTATION=-
MSGQALGAFAESTDYSSTAAGRVVAGAKVTPEAWVSWLEQFSRPQTLSYTLLGFVATGAASFLSAWACAWRIFGVVYATMFVLLWASLLWASLYGTKSTRGNRGVRNTGLVVGLWVILGLPMGFMLWIMLAREQLPNSCLDEEERHDALHVTAGTFW